MLHDILAAAVGALFVFGSFYITYLLGMLQSCRRVNTNLLNERTGMETRVKQVTDLNQQLLQREQAILSKAFHIHFTPDQLMNLAQMLGPYLAPAAEKPKVH